MLWLLLTSFETLRTSDGRRKNAETFINKTLFWRQLKHCGRWKNVVRIIWLLLTSFGTLWTSEERRKSVKTFIHDIIMFKTLQTYFLDISRKTLLGLRIIRVRFSIQSFITHSLWTSDGRWNNEVWIIINAVAILWTLKCDYWRFYRANNLATVRHQDSELAISGPRRRGGPRKTWSECDKNDTWTGRAGVKRLTRMQGK